MSFFTEEKGSALVKTLIAVFIVTTLIVSIADLAKERSTLLKIDSFRQRRDEVAKSLVKNIINYENIIASAKSFQSNKGNKILASCLGLNKTGSSDNINTGDRTLCLDSVGEKIPFFLTASKGVEKFYCPDLEEGYKCKLSGGDDFNKIGYSFDGAPGRFDIYKRPLIAKAYFKIIPFESRLMGSQDTSFSKRKMPIARFIEVKTTLEHKPLIRKQKIIGSKYSQNISYNLGFYPPPSQEESSWIKLSQRSIAAHSCNEGAVISDGGKGFFVSVNQLISQKVKNGKIQYNARGVLCVIDSKPCPLGTIYMGMDDSRVPPKARCMKEKDMYEKSNTTSFSSNEDWNPRTRLTLSEAIKIKLSLRSPVILVKIVVLLEQ